LAISELGTLSSKLATGQNPRFFTASSLTVLAADFLSGLGTREDVTNTRTAIIKHQKTALLGLQILTELLVAPVRDHIWYCSNIIFAPHEILRSVPLCGLRNKETFLIQEKTISLISDVRALHQLYPATSI
jgi:hypothetical protein